MKFFDQNSAPAIPGNLANYTFRPRVSSWLVTKAILFDLEFYSLGEELKIKKGDFLLLA